eukprot:TRINITY_DN689_c0_g1_i2.p2 TRINITY_DN689_c0_g1~~TRINITY_DN689_c0_g1_i2.p2  ORF type:complete len:434 (-),score=108.66 TRINITY_DN689_c0_g1_i2:8-1309(-)
MYRIWTQHGRTDELAATGKKKGGCVCETRYMSELGDAEILYEDILESKLSEDKGYRRVDVVSASPLIGSKPRTTTTEGDADEAAEPSTLHPAVQSIVRFLFEEASEIIMKSVAAKVTSRGIETPLGLLSLDQILAGERVLFDLDSVLHEHECRSLDAVTKRKVEALNSEFYSLIPAVLGKTKREVMTAVIDSPQAIQEKLELLQMMKDISKVTTASFGQQTHQSEIDRMYSATGAKLERVENGVALREIFTTLGGSGTGPVTQLRLPNGAKLANVFKVSRGDRERNAFREASRRLCGETPLLLHGSRSANCLGILSRGMLLPTLPHSADKARAPARSDFGYLGAGLYFTASPAVCLKYATAGRPASRAVAFAARVALGSVKRFRQVSPWLTAAPDGHDSCMGVAGAGSDWTEDEYAIYNTSQQQLEYLLEFTW